jgi:hypothetical protein
MLGIEGVAEPMYRMQVRNPSRKRFEGILNLGGLWFRGRAW